MVESSNTLGIDTKEYERMQKQYVDDLKEFIKKRGREIELKVIIEGNEEHLIEIYPWRKTVADIKVLIQDKFGIQIDRQNLIYKGKCL